MQSFKEVGQIDPKKTIFFLCDVQDGYTPRTFNMPMVVHTCAVCCKLAKLFNVPLLVAEQDRANLGDTVADIKKEWPTENIKVYEKFQFNMLTPEILDYLAQHKDRDTIVIFGLWIHNCVKHTTLDLLKRGWKIHIVADGVSSHTEFDRSVSMHRCVHAGAYATTSESLGLEMCFTAKNPLFPKVVEFLNDPARPKTGFTNL